MTTASLSSHPSLVGSRSLLHRAWSFNWPLTLTVLVNLALVPLLLAAMLLDPKVITGMNAWIKPLNCAL